MEEIIIVRVYSSVLWINKTLLMRCIFVPTAMSESEYLPDHKLTLLSSGGMGSIRLMGNPGYDNHIRYDYPSMTKNGETPTNLSQVDHWVAGCDSSTVLSDDFLIWNSNRNKIDFLIDHTTGNVGIGITGYNSSQGSSITTLKHHYT